jgi:hypothetical protein
MLFALALTLAGIATAQDMTEEASGLLAYTTSVGPCTTNTIPEDEIVFSVQTDTIVETPGPQNACTFLVNADNPTQIVSTITGEIPTISGTVSNTNLIILTGSPSSESMESSSTSSGMASAPSSTGSVTSSTAFAPGSTSASSGSDMTSASAPTSTGTGVAAKGVAGDVFGLAGFAAMVAGFFL